MKRLFGLVLLVAALLVVPAVFAGGWATVTMDELPTEIHAGEPFTIGFVVRQHGQTPVHVLGDGFPVKPVIVATNSAGETVQFTASPIEELGHFEADITLPSEGEWAWSITPQPFPQAQELEPLTVLPAPQATLLGSQAFDNGTAAGGLTSQALLRVAGAGLALVGLVVYLWQRRRQPHVVAPHVEG